MPRIMLHLLWNIIKPKNVSSILIQVFKYDSSQDKYTHVVPNTNNQLLDEGKEDTQNNLFGHKNTVFFDSNDIQFNEAYIKKL